MAYTFKYRLSQAPSPTNDGSGVVAHDIWAIAYDNGEGQIVPGRHKTVMIPGDQLQAVMDLPNDGAKIAAYKDTLRANLNTTGVPITGWSTSALELLMTTNDAAASVAAEANDYITVTLGQSYPVEFNL